MNKQFSVIVKSHSIYLYYVILFYLLFVVFLPSFRNPPRSDYWSAFYVFHLVDTSPAPPSWFDIFNYDPWQHGTFRPLSYFILYLEHRLFGANFVWNHVVTFIMYCLTILLMYGLMKQFSLNRLLAAAFLAVFSFLFTHFDILTWTFHVYSIMGFCAFLLGFILYCSFLRSGRWILLLPVLVLFLFGMFCYEVYALWPLAILIITYVPGVVTGESAIRKSRHLSIVLLVLAYALYLTGFLISRSATSYMGKLSLPPPLFKGVAFLSVFFNLFYNGILLNIVPDLSVPPVIKDNVNLGGLLLKLIQTSWPYAPITPRLPLLPLGGGAAVFILILGGGIFLGRKKRFHTLGLLSFFLFLYFANFFTVTLARLTTNPLIYTFIQFRYQYVPNALLIFMALVLLTGLVKPARREKVLICCALIPLLLVNLHLTSKYVRVLSNHFAPLRVMLDNIRLGIESGRINQNAKLYIDSGITSHLPPLCWNVPMSRFMKGTYQWLFPRDEIKYFAFSRQDATWVIRKDDYTKIYRTDQQQ